MTDEQFETVNAVMLAEGIEVTETGFRKMNGKGKMAPYDASAHLDAAGITAAEFMDEWRKREALRQVNEMRSLESDTEEDVRTPYKKKQFVHGAIGELPPWGKADDRFFGKFRFAKNPMDGSFVVVVMLDTTRLKVVPVTSNPASMVTAIASAASCAEPVTKGRYKSLYDELDAGYREAMSSVVKRWRNKEFRGSAEFVKMVAMHLPHIMLTNLDWMVTGEKVTKMVGNQQRTFEVPTGMELSSNRSMCNPIKFLAHNIDKFIARPELVIPMPKVYTNDPSVPAMSYVDLDAICKDGPCPTWDKYMMRYRPDHGEAFMAFIWSILDAGNTGRQMLYIIDNGYTAKSYVMNCIHDVLGPEICTSMQKDSMGNQFALAKIWDKRLVTYGDNKNPKLLMTEKMHMITGGDYAEIEMKGRNSFHAKLQCKVIASGNVPLEIRPDAVHETSRLIQVTTHMTEDMLKEFCVLDGNGNVRRRSNGTPVFKGDPSFQDRLKAEFPQFLTKCREVYSRLCPSRADIVISDEMFDEMMALAPVENYTVADFFDRNFEFSEAAMMPVHTNSSTKRAPFSFADFKEYVEKKFERRVKFGVVRSYNGKSTRVHLGLRPKEGDNNMSEGSLI